MDLLKSDFESVQIASPWVFFRSKRVLPCQGAELCPIFLAYSLSVVACAHLFVDIAMDGEDMKQWNTPQKMQEKLYSRRRRNATWEHRQCSSRVAPRNTLQGVARCVQSHVCRLAQTKTLRRALKGAQTIKVNGRIQLEAKHSSRDQHPSTWPQMHIYATSSTFGGGAVCPVIRA
jgi:hypothetical protein